MTADPTIHFGPGGVVVRGTRAGAKVAWLGMIRERGPHHIGVRLTRGLRTSASGEIEIAEPGIGEAAALWAVVDASNGAAAHAAGPKLKDSAPQITIRAHVGAANVAVESAVIEILYVRPGVGAWTFGGGDGSARDADLTPNGVIVIPLAALQALDGQTAPPVAAENRDVIVAIDPHRNRITRLAVSK